MSFKGVVIWRLVGSGLLVVTPLVIMLTRVGGFGLRDTADLFAMTLGSPLTLAFPLAIGLLAAGPLAISIETRWIANTRTRTDARRYVTSSVRGAGILGAVVGALMVLVPGVVCFVVWPLLGNPSIDPEGYFLTAEQARIESFSRFTYSEWLELGPWFFVTAYSAVVAIAGFAFAVLSVTATLIVPNAYLGAVLPGGLAVLATIGSALFGMPQTGIIYSIFPFGLQQVSWSVAVVPLGLVVVIAVILFSYVSFRARTLNSLR